MKQFTFKDGVKIIASTRDEAIAKHKALAFNADNLSDSTKELFETMNNGNFQYNYRTDDDFKDFVKTTLLDEIVDTIKSSKTLITRCIENRVQSYSIVWGALFQIFEYVKKRNALSASINSATMKKWFEYNNTDYKTALQPIVEYVDKQLRPDLRQSEKVVATRVNRVGNTTTEFAYPVLDVISKRLVSKIPSSKLKRIRQGYALIETPKGYNIEFEMNDNTKDSFVRVLEGDEIKKQFKINNWYDTTIPELYTKVSTELKQGMHKLVAFAEK